MSVICLNWETVHLYGNAWISHHRLRYRLFVERQGWDVPNHQGLEYDEFDTPAARYILWLDERGEARGSVRLIPTSRPYMVASLWPDLVAGSLPSDPCVWEATRFGCDRDLDPPIRRRVIAELICGCQEFGLKWNISHYLSVMPLGVFKHVIAAAGCSVKLLGAAKKLGRLPTAAAYVSVSKETLHRVRKRAGINGAILPKQMAEAA